MKKISLNKETLITKISEKLNKSKAEATKFFDFFIENVKDYLIKGWDVKFSGFGTFKLVNRKASIRRNIKTGEKINVPAKKAIRFIPSEKFKKDIN